MAGIRTGEGRLRDHRLARDCSINVVNRIVSKRHIVVLVVLVFPLGIGMHAHAADDVLTELPTPVDHDRAADLDGLDSENPKAELKDKKRLGIEYTSPNKRFFINPWLRLQLRFSDPFDGDPRNEESFDNTPGDELEVRRARLKIEGYMFNPKVGFYYEHELSGEHPLLDLRLDLDLRNDIQMRIGQHKVLYNRERVDSSGKQQFV